MNMSSQIEFPIAPPAIRRVMSLGATCFFLTPVTWLAWRVGLIRFSSAPAGWAVLLMCLLPAGIFLRIAFPPRDAMAKLQITRDKISFIPGRWVRRFAGEPNIETKIAPQATEILIRQKGLINGYGITVCSAGLKLGEIFAGASLTMHSAEEIRVISEGIAGATDLPVRAVRCVRGQGGIVQENPWTTIARGGAVTLALRLASGALPFVAGALVGLVFPPGKWVLAVGICVILVQSQLLKPKKRTAIQRVVAAIIAFVIAGSAYGLSFVLGSHFAGKL